MITLDTVQVERVLIACVATDEEIHPSLVIQIQGYKLDPDGDTMLYQFDPALVAENQGAIRELTLQLPARAQVDREKGGPVRVDHLNVNDAGEVWDTTGWYVEYLVMLAIAAACAEWSLPRESWPDLPDGVAAVGFSRPIEGVTSLPAGTAVL